MLFWALYRVFKSMELLCFDRPTETDVVCIQKGFVSPPVGNRAKTFLTDIARFSHSITISLKSSQELHNENFHSFPFPSFASMNQIHITVTSHIPTQALLVPSINLCLTFISISSPTKTVEQRNVNTLIHGFFGSIFVGI